MNKRLTYLVRTQTLEHGEPVEGHTDGATVFAALLSVSERETAVLGRYEHRVDRIALVDPHAQALGGNQCRVAGVEYSILGVDDTHIPWRLHLSKEVRGE